MSAKGINSTSSPIVQTSKHSGERSDSARSSSQLISQLGQTYQPLSSPSSNQNINSSQVLQDPRFPMAPPSVNGSDLDSSGSVVDPNLLSAEVTCRKSIKASCDQALFLQREGQSGVSATLALNDEPYDQLEKHFVKLVRAGIPVRIVAGDRATRVPGREYGAIILKTLLDRVASQMAQGKYNDVILNKVKLKVCFHDGGAINELQDSIRIARSFNTHVDEVSLQLQPLEKMQESLNVLAKVRDSMGLSDTEVVCYAIIFASQEAYERAPDRIKALAAHTYADQADHLRQLQSMVDQYDNVSIRLSFYGFSKLSVEATIDALDRWYAVMRDC